MLCNDNVTCLEQASRLYGSSILPLRCVLSAMAGLQLDHAALVLKAMAHDPAQLRKNQEATFPTAADAAATSSQGDTTGLAAAVMVLERVLMVGMASFVAVPHGT